MVTADCDLRVGLRAKRWFDAVGHYSRDDVLAPDRPGGQDGDPLELPGGPAAP